MWKTRRAFIWLPRNMVSGRGSGSGSGLGSDLQSGLGFIGMNILVEQSHCIII
jgi:hypothetical protein